MVQILRNLYQPLVLAGAVICVVFVFVNLNNHNMTAHVQEQARPSSGAATFYLLVTHPGDIRKFSLQKRGDGGLLRLVIVNVRLFREKQMDKAA